ncbi:MAG TPA: AbrB/MazE/SpoVT family DNA-binding domain-containing protein [Bacillota bacterium]|nr:AbrB/MazE/SpoVT family DNA-binding domain-containing protein [Bacillota bacterium]
MARVTAKGQVTLPKRVRDALGIRPGTEVEFEVQEGRAILRRRPPAAALERWRGALKDRGTDSDALIEELRGR